MSENKMILVSRQDFQLFQALFHERIGLHLSLSKMQLLSARLGSRIQELGLLGFHAYYMRIQQDPAEFQIAVDRITTHETSFFREPRHFEILRNQILPWRDNTPLLAWSAACSTGEEPWSVAMTLECFGQGVAWKVLATDISVRELEYASEALYPMTQSRSIPEAYLKRCCLRGTGTHEGYFTLAAHLRNNVTFRQLNLLEIPERMGLFPIIFLRNAIIYFDFATKVRVLRSVCEHLRPNGWLFLGHSESIVGMDLPLHQIEPSVFRKIT